MPGLQTDVGDAGQQNHPHSLPRFFAGNTQPRRALLVVGNVFNKEVGDQRRQKIFFAVWPLGGAHGWRELIYK